MRIAGTFLITTLPLSGKLRYRLSFLSGVKILGSHGFIGKHVTFDSIQPELIEIEAGVHLTEGTIIYTHHLQAENFSHRKVPWYKYGKVHIEKNVFIGARTIICNSVTIGESSVIAAGSVVTKDIPSHELWGGVPARCIKKFTVTKPQ